VAGEERNNIRLVVGHAAGNTDTERRLSDGFVRQRMQTAIEMHDREVKRHSRWILYLPLIIAILGAVGSVVTVLVSLLISKR